MFSLFPTLLTLHLTGFAMMAGTTVIEFINYQSFWRMVQQQQQAAGVLSIMAKTSKLVGLGAALLILSGAGMIAMTHGLMAAQLWFKIKMVLVVLLILNGILFGNRISAKIRRNVESHEPAQTAQLQLLKGKLEMFYWLQVAILVAIIFLAAYKFN